MKSSIRGAIDFAIADVAAVLEAQDGICQEARIVVSSVGPAVVRAVEAEELLKEKRIDRDLIEEAAKAAVRATPLISGAFCSIYYRRKMIYVLTKRALKQAMGMEREDRATP